MKWGDKREIKWIRVNFLHVNILFRNFGDMEVKRVQIFPEPRKKLAGVKSVWQIKKNKISFSPSVQV